MAELLTVLGIAVGLAMDAFAVSVVGGATSRELKVRHILRMAFFFGAFQATMPLVGLLAGLSVKGLIARWDHWVAFGLLATIGGKMIWESFRMKGLEDRFDARDVFVVLALSVATSIDALVVGVSLSILVVSVVFAVVVIGVVTFVLSLVGTWLGDKVGHFSENVWELIGGLVLIGLGVKVLLEHLLGAGPVGRI
jgi:putative Mn2+ efflux pump MntP